MHEFRSLSPPLFLSTCLARRFQALCNSDDEQAKQREQEAFAQKVREMELAHQAQQARAKRGPGAASETVLVLAFELETHIPTVTPTNT